MEIKATSGKLNYDILVTITLQSYFCILTDETIKIGNYGIKNLLFQSTLIVAITEGACTWYGEAAAGITPAKK